MRGAAGAAGVPAREWWQLHRLAAVPGLLPRPHADQRMHALHCCHRRHLQLPHAHLCCSAGCCAAASRAGAGRPASTGRWRVRVEASAAASSHRWLIGEPQAGLHAACMLPLTALQPSSTSTPGTCNRSADPASATDRFAHEPQCAPNCTCRSLQGALHLVTGACAGGVSQLPAHVSAPLSAGRLWTLMPQRLGASVFVAGQALRARLPPRPLQALKPVAFATREHSQ